MSTETPLEPRQISRYGWRPSLPDQRDLKANTSGLVVLDEVDPRDDMPAVYDQLQLGSCTANAVAAALEYEMILDDESVFTPSRLAIYWLERWLEGGEANTQQDTGAYGRDGFRAARKFGFAPEPDWPYLIAKFRDDPRYPLSVDFDRYKLRKDYRAVPRSIVGWKRVLSNRQTIAFGFSVYDSFESREVERTGIVPMPTKDERLLGGHEVLAVGYLRKYPDHALCRNSWGEDWGMGGYFLMPWHLLMNRYLASDFRTIRRPAGT